MISNILKRQYCICLDTKSAMNEGVGNCPKLRDFIYVKLIAQIIFLLNQSSDLKKSGRLCDRLPDELHGNPDVHVMAERQGRNRWNSHDGFEKYNGKTLPRLSKRRGSSQSKPLPTFPQSAKRSFFVRQTRWLHSLP